jgi:hypothetical protein
LLTSLMNDSREAAKSPKKTRSPCNAGSSGNGRRGTSLQRAAGGMSSFSKRQSKEGTTTAVKTETSFVIGCGDTSFPSHYYAENSYPSTATATRLSELGDETNTNDTHQLQQQQQHHYNNNVAIENSMTIGGPDTDTIPFDHRHQHYPNHFQAVPHNYDVPSSYHHQINHADHFLVDDDDHEMDDRVSYSMEDNYNLSHPDHHSPHHHPPLIKSSYYSSPVHGTPTASTSSVIRSTPIPTSYVVGEAETVPALHDTSPMNDYRPMQKMEGVEDLGTKMPLVVLDGANVAHHYAQAISRYHEASSSSSLAIAKSGKPEPDAQGIQVATDHFVQAGLRVLVVLPQYWFKVKPRPGDHGINHNNSNNNDNNALMETPQLEILNDLKAKGLIVASPPTDDDDAYALTIARREELRSLSKRKGEGPGFVVSNDLFRDAQDRDNTGVLRQWLKHGRHDTVGPGRISYTFGDMGTMNDRGERILDFIPNPRHPLVIWMESQQLLSHP